MTARPSLASIAKAVAAPRVKRVRDGNAEARIQASIVEWIRTVAPQVIIFHVPNGGKRSKSEASRLKWVGVLGGVLDLVLVLPSARIAFWEVKTKSGRLSSAQKNFVAWIQARGHSCVIVRSIDDARAELSKLGIKTRESAS